MAMTSRAATGRSVSCSRVSIPNIRTGPPSGMTDQEANAATAVSIGAMLNTSASVRAGRKSSLKSSFTPSPSAWPRPRGPFMIGPLRFCILPSTRRSNHTLKMVQVSSRTKTPTTLIRMSHQGSLRKTVSMLVMPHLLRS